VLIPLGMLDVASVVMGKQMLNAVLFCVSLDRLSMVCAAVHQHQ